MAWLILIVAGIFEIAWAIGLKYTGGFTLQPLREHPVAAVLTIIAIILSMGLLGLAMQKLPVGTAYAVWTGIGTLGTAILGMVLFNDPATVARILFLTLIIAGILGLKFVSP